MKKPRRRVVLVDDSELFVDVLTDLIDREPSLELVGVASDGAQAVEIVRRLRPDVVVMDVLMPGLDGLEATEQIMAECPTPILVLSADPRSRTGALSIEALARGALDVMPKPERVPFDRLTTDRLVERIGLLAEVAVVRHVRGRRHQWRGAPTAAVIPPAPAPRESLSVPIVAIAASTGGPQALASVIGGIPNGFPGTVLLVQHMSPAFVPAFARWLQGTARLQVRVAEQGEGLSAATVVIAPPGRHLELQRGRLALMADGAGPHCPSADRLFSSLARGAAPRTLGVVLTGMGRDGTAGLSALREAGSHTIVQDAASSVVDGMPRAAREAGAACTVAPLDDIADEIVRWVAAR